MVTVIVDDEKLVPVTPTSGEPLPESLVAVAAPTPVNCHPVGAVRINVPPVTMFTVALSISVVWAVHPED